MTAAPAFTAKPEKPENGDHATYLLIKALRRAGFTLMFTGETLHVAPSSQLDDQQRTAIRAAKAQIIHLLKIEAAPPPQPITPITWQQLPPAPPPVACGDCRHSAAIPDSDPVYGWRTCGLQLGGGLARQDRRCDGFEATGQEAAP